MNEPFHAPCVQKPCLKKKRQDFSFDVRSNFRATRNRDVFSLFLIMRIFRKLCLLFYITDIGVTFEKIRRLTLRIDLN